MSRFILLGLVVSLSAVAWWNHHGQAQSPQGELFRGAAPVRVSDEKAARQAEVLRLQQMVLHLEARVRRLEQQAEAPNRV
ncbi:MAG: hypothetical protein MI861_13895, partial [Pirellulales bacterium]|nr:hypothetical protein [Pirellulales bacterium]